MKRRTFIGKALLLAMSLPFAIRRAKALVPEIIVAMIILVVGTIIIAQLVKLCKRVLPNPKAPPKNDSGSTSQSASISQTVSIPITPDQSCVGSITDQTTAFQTPSGTFYHTMIGMNVQTSTDLITWSGCGSITMWVSDDYMAVQQVDAAGNIISKLIYNWKSLESVPGFNGGFEPSDKRYFKTITNL